MPESNPGTGDLISHWSLEEAAGNGDRVDDHGVNDLTASHTPGQVAGVVGNAVDLISTADELTIAHATQVGLDFEDEDISMVTWIKLDRNNATEGFIAKWGTSGSFGYYLHRSGGDKKAEFFVSDSGSNTAVVKHADALTTATWYMLYAYHDHGTELGISVDGGTITTNAHTAGLHLSTAKFNLGRRSDDAEMFQGVQDQTAIFGRLLTADEVAYMFNSGSGRSYAELAAASVGGVKRSATFF